ncbi:MAG TPA: serine hydrolase [archaeon]|nr:serine hydrolase [archaeon]
MKRVLALLAALFLGAFGCAESVNRPGEGELEFAQAAQVDSLVAQELEPGGPGCAVAIFKDGAIAFKRGYGMANLDYRLPVTSATVFDIASISKQFTAACILMLAERGELSLDDDIRRFIPEFPDYGTKIEIRHLIHHTSGIRDWVWLLALAGMPFENILSRQDLYRLITRQKGLVFAPGDGYKYSNSGYNLLALIVERVTGMSFADFAAREIFEPLGMKNTLIFDDRRMVVRNRAFGYIPDEDSGYCMEQYFNPAILGSSNIHSTVEDLFLWDRNFYSNKVGPPDLAGKMATQGRLNSGDTIDYAFGLEVRERRGLKTVSHEGDWAGFLSCMLRFPEQKFTVVCLANTQAFSPKALCYRIADLCLADRYGQEVPSEPQEQPVERIPVAVDPVLYDHYAGVYEADNGRKITVKKENGRLMGRLPGRRKFEMLPCSESEFFLKERNVLVTFLRDERGQVSRLEWQQGQRTVAYVNLKNRPPTSQSPEKLAEYAGDYFSDELIVTYQVTAGEDGLVLKTPIKSRYLMDLTGITGSDPLRPLEKDKYRFAFMYLLFERNARGKVNGFTLIHEGAGLRMKFARN